MTAVIVNNSSKSIQRRRPPMPSRPAMGKSTANVGSSPEPRLLAVVAAVLTCTVTVCTELPDTREDGVMVALAPTGKPVRVSVTSDGKLLPLVGDNCNE